MSIFYQKTMEARITQDEYISFDDDCSEMFIDLMVTTTRVQILDKAFSYPYLPIFT